MKPRPWHRWLGLGRHRLDLARPPVAGLDPALPPLRRCACRRALGLRVGDLTPSVEDPDEVIWTPTWVLLGAAAEVTRRDGDTST